MGKYVLFWVLVILAEVAFVALLVSPERALQQMAMERQSVAQVFGDEVASTLQGKTSSAYKTYFQDSGLVQLSYAMTTPTRAQQDASFGMEDLGHELFLWVRGRLKTFWNVVYAGLYRLNLLWLLVPYMLPFIAPSLVDGLVEREIKKASFGYASAVIYHASKRIALGALIFPVVLFMAPVAMPVWVFFIWCFGLPLVVWMGASNVQHKI